MSNLHEVKPRVTKITLKDGVERELVFTLNAMAELEDRYGTVQAAFEALDSGSIKAIRLALWAGLMDSDDTLTEQQVGRLIDVNNIQDMIKTMSSALADNMPENGSEVAALPNA